MFGRSDILHYVSEKYKTVPEKLWPKKYPTFEILRHNHNKKWYALFGQVDAKYLGLEKGKKIDILNVKASPDFIEFLLAQEAGDELAAGKMLIDKLQKNILSKLVK